MATMMSGLVMDPAKAKAFFQEELAFTTGPIELDRMRRQKENIRIVDVREPEDYQQGHVPGAINLPKERWSNVNELRKDGVNVMYCYSQTCHLAKRAALEFADRGYPVMEMEGGFKSWQSHALPIEK